MAIRSVPVDQAQLGLSFISASPKRDLEGVQRTRADGTPLVTVSLLATPPNEPADVVNITVPASGVAKDLPQYAAVRVVEFTARHWDMNGRSGLALSGSAVHLTKA
jgi:hypothetical protein